MGENEALEYSKYKEVEILLKRKKTYFEMFFCFGPL
jgi:hypothetical protein